MSNTNSIILLWMVDFEILFEFIIKSRLMFNLFMWQLNYVDIFRI